MKKLNNNYERRIAKNFVCACEVCPHCVNGDHISHAYADFQPGDGTRYNLTIVPEEHGGLLVCCNHSSMWRFYPESSEIKFLCGNHNDWTEIAIVTYMIHWNEWIGFNTNGVQA